MEPVAKPRVRFTRKDYEQLPEDFRAELIEGDLVMVPAPDPSHQSLLGVLHACLLGYLGRQARHRLLVSPVDLHIDDENIVQPDLLVLPEGTRAQKRPWRIPHPVWIAEVLSPKTASRDRGVKLRLYARVGVREAWLVDPDAETVEVRPLGADAGDAAASPGRPYRRGETAESGELVGLAVPLDELFDLDA